MLDVQDHWGTLGHGELRGKRKRKFKETSTIARNSVYLCGEVSLKVRRPTSS